MIITIGQDITPHLHMRFLLSSVKYNFLPHAFSAAAHDSTIWSKISVLPSPGMRNLLVKTYKIRRDELPQILAKFFDFHAID